MVEVGFEPTPPKRLELESSALDHSAIQPSASACAAFPLSADSTVGVGRGAQQFSEQKVRRPGIKPGSGPWQGPILSLY